MTKKGKGNKTATQPQVKSTLVDAHGQPVITQALPQVDACKVTALKTLKALDVPTDVVNTIVRDVNVMRHVLSTHNAQWCHSVATPDPTCPVLPTVATYTPKAKFASMLGDNVPAQYVATIGYIALVQDCQAYPAQSGKVDGMDANSRGQSRVAPLNTWGNLSAMLSGGNKGDLRAWSRYFAGSGSPKTRTSDIGKTDQQGDGVGSFDPGTVMYRLCKRAVALRAIDASLTVPLVDGYIVPGLDTAVIIAA